MVKKVYVLVPVTLEESLDKNAGLTFLKEHPVTNGVLSELEVKPCLFSTSPQADDDVNIHWENNYVKSKHLWAPVMM